MTTATKTRTSVKPTTRKAAVQTIGTTRVLWLTNDKLTLAYRLESIPSDLGGIAFQLSKAHQGGDEQPEVYHVLLNGQNTSCTCAGHSFRGKCKHVDGLEALLKAGKIAAPAAKPQAEPAPQQPTQQEPETCWEPRCNRPAVDGCYCELHNGI